jgi:hypothetical protein
MPGGANRTAMRANVRAALAALPRMADVPDRGILAPRPDLSQIPERMVATPLERPEVASAAGTDRTITLEVVIRRKGADAQDALDLDQDVIEPAVIAALGQGSTVCDLTEARLAFEPEGKTPLAQLTLTFTVLQFD